MPNGQSPPIPQYPPATNTHPSATGCAAANDRPPTQHHTGQQQLARRRKSTPAINPSAGSTRIAQRFIVVVPPHPGQLPAG